MQLISKLFEQSFINFTAKQGELIRIKFNRKSQPSCAEIKVMKATVVENNNIGFVTANVKGLSPGKSMQNKYLFESDINEELET